jgi:hypothetical protein
VAEKEDRLKRLRRLESLRRIAADVAKGDSQGLAEVKEEGRQIVAAREEQLTRGLPWPPGEPQVDQHEPERVLAKLQKKRARRA